MYSKENVLVSAVVLQLEEVMKCIPQLTNFGIGLFYSDYELPQNERLLKLANSRNDLRISVADVERTIEWLNKNIQPIQTINYAHTSYGLKHIAEKDIGYITNGVFIAAAIIAGFKYKIRNGSPNVLFAMSEKSINRIAFTYRHGLIYVSEGI